MKPLAGLVAMAVLAFALLGQTRAPDHTTDSMQFEIKPQAVPTSLTVIPGYTSDIHVFEVGIRNKCAGTTAGLTIQNGAGTFDLFAMADSNIQPGIVLVRTGGVLMEGGLKWQASSSSCMYAWITAK